MPAPGWLGLAAWLALPLAPAIHELTMDVPAVGRVMYGLSVPAEYDASTPTVLVVALHPGGPRPRQYGAAFTRALVEPALRDLRPIIAAPDCPPTAQSWSDPAADAAVLAVVAEVMRHYNVDRTRVLVTGFSMGGRGAWFEASTHPDLFTAAIPIASSTEGLTFEQLARQPTYVIHSRADEVVPFLPADRTTRMLRQAGRTIQFEALDAVTHFDVSRYTAALRRAAQWVAEQWRN